MITLNGERTVGFFFDKGKNILTFNQKAINSLYSKSSVQKLALTEMGVRVSGREPR